MAEKNVSYHNLIDLLIALEENPELTGNSTELFRRVLCEYFFEQETKDSKSLEIYLNDFPVPSFIAEKASLTDIDIDQLRTFVEGNMVKDSLSGSIMLSTAYLKTFYSNHPPSFSKMPEDVQFEIMEHIKQKNNQILAAFEKMKLDREADKKRKVITLVALIIKNIFLKTGRPLIKLQKPADEIIRSIIYGADEIFIASQKQIAEISDDKKIKDLIKSFFKVMQFKEISDITAMYREELERYKKRGATASGAALKNKK